LIPADARTTPIHDGKEFPMRGTSEAVREVVCLVITGSGGETTVLPVLGRRFLIGRAKNCQLRSLNPLVSREHAVIESDDEASFLHDLASCNGTFWNGTRVTRPVRLRDGDSIQIGPIMFGVSIQPIEEGPEEQPEIEDQVASWLIDEPKGSGRESDMGLSGGATQIRAPHSDAR